MRGKRIANSIWKEKNKVQGLTLSDFKMHYKAIRTKTEWYQGNNKQLDQRNRIENPEIDPHKYSQLIFEKGTKANNGANIVFLTNGAGSWTSTYQKNESRPLHPSQTLTQNGS